MPEDSHARERHAGREHVRSAEHPLRVQARDCLTASNYSRSEAIAAVDAALAHVGTEVPLEVLLREAFRRCSRP